MRVILLKDIPDLGDAGDVVEVEGSHAQDTLFPKHLAISATEEALAEHAAAAEAQRIASEHELGELQQLAEDLDGYELVITASANAEGTLTGAIGIPQIVTRLAAEGRDVAGAWMQLDTPLTEIGEYTVRCAMPHGLEAEFRVIVEAA
ncbi:MAG: 50S ribosomal protein L9 [bacterium]|nr:50S ribosomal protein L9 [bacterium]